MSDNPTCGELFAGAGGFSLGLDRVGIQTKWMVEIDKQCQGILRRHWPDALIFDDVCEVGEHNLPRVDIITFGSPCQDLSVAGLRAGLEGSRSGLFFEAARIIGELRPAIAIWENVSGALTSRGGRDFAAVLAALANIGALDISWAILDSSWFNVAQRRERLFVVADFRGERASEILALPEGLRWNPAPSRGTREETTRGFSSSSFGGFVEGAGTQRVGGGGTPETCIVGPLAVRGEQTYGPFVTGPLTASDFRGPNHMAVEAGKIIAVRTDNTNANGIGVTEDVTGTLSGSNGVAVMRSWIPTVSHALSAEGADASEDGTGRGSPLVEITEGIRRLTPIESERLQSWPDNHTKWDWTGKVLSDSARFKMIGNGVVSNVVEWIGRRIVEVWE